MNWKKISIISSVIVLCVCLAGLAGYRLMQHKEDGLTVEVYQVSDNSYGYKIIQNERPLIVQPFIPGISQKQPFTTPDDARRVGEWVRKRMKAGEVYSITPEELNRLGIKTY